MSLINTRNLDCGIYLITNNLNNKKYVGQSTKLNNRWNTWKSGSYKNRLIEEDLQDKPFINHIKFEILEYCSKEKLNEREIFYINKFNTLYPNGYNQQTGGINGFTLTEDLYNRCVETNRRIFKKHKEAVMENWNTNVKNRFWYNNGEENVYIHPEEFELYEANGYKRGRILDNASKKGLMFVYNIDTWDVKQIKVEEFDEYFNKGYRDGLLRKNGIIWIYNNEYYKSAKRLANYLQLHGYPNITRQSVEHIVMGNYTGEYQDLMGKIHNIKAIDLYNKRGEDV